MCPSVGLPVTFGRLVTDTKWRCALQTWRSYSRNQGPCTLESCPFHMLPSALLGQIQSLGDTPSFWGPMTVGPAQSPSYTG